MATVSYQDITIECATALKGIDFVHLLDESGTMIAAFDGVSDFSGFSITGGSWVTPADPHECYVAVLREDGSIAAGGHRCCDLCTMAVYNVAFPATGWSSSAPYTQAVSVSGVQASDNPFVDVDMSAATTDTAADLLEGWACIGRIVAGAGTLTAYCYDEAPAVDLNVMVKVVR